MPITEREFNEDVAALCRTADCVGDLLAVLLRGAERVPDRMSAASWRRVSGRGAQLSAEISLRDKEPPILSETTVKNATQRVGAPRIDWIFAEPRRKRYAVAVEVKLPGRRKFEHDQMRRYAQVFR